MSPKLFEVPAVVVDGKLYLAKDDLVEYLRAINAEPRIIAMLQRGRQAPGARRFTELPPERNGRTD